MLSSKYLIVILFLLALTACDEYVRPSSGGISTHSSQGHSSVYFTDNDRYLIKQFYTNKNIRQKKRYKPMPPGLAKKKHMTPGHAKQLERKGRLPPGLEKRKLHYNLERSLSRLPDDFVRFTVGKDVVLFNERTHVIADIVYDIVR